MKDLLELMGAYPTSSFLIVMIICQTIIELVRGCSKSEEE